MSRFFSYVVTHDSGFAPNPYGGVLTLATCKPRIRLTARSGDWILGTGSVAAVGSNRLVFAARISEVVSIETYGTDSRFDFKRPSLTGEPWKRDGDNIYIRKNDGTWVQRRNPHHFTEDMAHDLSGRNVLVCTYFWYFGRSAPNIPTRLHDVAKRGPGHKFIEDRARCLAVLRWLRRAPCGMHGAPFMTR